MAMDGESDLINALEQRKIRRESRREMFRSFGMAALATGGLIAVTKPTAAFAQSTISDADVLNFALQLFVGFVHLFKILAQTLHTLLLRFLLNPLAI